MIIVEAQWPFCALLACAVVALVAVVALRKRIVARIGAACARLRPIVAALCVPLGFLLMELPYNAKLLTMQVQFAVAGIFALMLLFCIVYYLGQRSRAAMAVFLAVCLVFGLVNYFLALFKGQPLLPSDVLAIKTAVAVSTGYDYVLNDNVLLSVAVFVFYLCLIVLMPKKPLTRKHVLASTGVGVAITVLFAVWFGCVSIADRYEVKVDVWSSLGSYQKYGSGLCFLQRCQLLRPAAPEGYSSGNADAIMASYLDKDVNEGVGDEGSDAASAGQQPAIVVIMNETFSDLSRYPGMEEYYAGPTFYNSIDNAIVKGEAYVSALGGGTCNSEFEYLTGVSCGLLGGGVYPYMLYSMEGVGNIASYLSSMGYDTSAIHPAPAENWRRDRVYQQLGFDTFYDISAFEDAEYFRNMPTDASTYDIVLDILESDESPQFIFDVTIANHSGYDGKIPDSERSHIVIDGEDKLDFNEYVSCIERSDRELQQFLADLEALDRPVVVCFFGDHQPGFVSWVSEMTYGEEAISAMGAEGAQQRFITPYMIWTNDDALYEANGGRQQAADTSLNYLATATLEAAGIPLNDWFAFLENIQEDLPIINLNGYLDSDGVWRWHKEGSVSFQAYNDLAIVQYKHLFGN